jgi:hypothetical protein
MDTTQLLTLGFKIFIIILKNDKTIVAYFVEYTVEKTSLKNSLLFNKAVIDF